MKNLLGFTSIHSRSLAHAFTYRKAARPRVSRGRRKNGTIRIEGPRSGWRRSQRGGLPSIFPVICAGSSAKSGRGLWVARAAPNRGLADFDAELKQFSVDAGRTPQRVGLTHAADQITDFGADLGSS